MGVIKKKNSARLLWNTKPSYVVNPKNIKFWTAEVVLPNQARDQRNSITFQCSIEYSD